MLENDASSRPFRSIWLPMILMLVALVVRVLSQRDILPSQTNNLSPLVAFAFVGAIVFPRRLAWWTWPLLIMAVDMLTNGSALWAQADHRLEVFLTYACYGAVAWFGAQLRGRAGVLDTMLGTLACSIGFFLLTNSLSWWVEPYYAKSFSGWFQALTVGVPGPWPPTAVFFRNSAIADQIAAAVLLLVYNTEAAVRQLRAMAWWGIGSKASSVTQ